MKPIDSQILYRDGRHYDLISARTAPDDVPFYLGQVERYGEPVLELGCGTGRVTIPLAERGIAIAGLDVAEAMLARARAKARERGVAIEFIPADCRDFDLGRKFKLIIFAFHHLLDQESVEACLGSVKKHLAEDGRFIIDVFNPSLKMLTRDPDRRYPVAEYDDLDGNGRVMVTESPCYDRATQVQRLKWFFEIGGQPEALVYEWDMRIFFPRELDALIRYNGFMIERKYGNYDETPFGSDSPKQILVCHAPRAGLNQVAP